MANGIMPTPDILLPIAMVIEIVGGVMIIIGWQTRLAAFICSGQMAVAYFYVSQPRGLFPINNHGELAVTFCFVFLFIAAYDAGIWSVDNVWEKASISTDVLEN